MICDGCTEDLETRELNGKNYCTGCFEEFFFECAHCGDTKRKPHKKEKFDDKYFCDDNCRDDSGWKPVEQPGEREWQARFR